MKTLHTTIFTITLLFLCTRLAAQEEQSAFDRAFAQLAAEEDEEAAGWDDVYDLLGNIASHPMNINTATREDLEQLPFLNGRQIEELCEYIYRHGPMRSATELQLIASLDRTRRQLLQCLVYMGDGPEKGFPTLKDIVKHGRSTLLATGKVPFYDRKGDRNGYLGYKYKHWLRYDFTSSDRVRLGLTASQDAGEPFFGNGNGAGYDYYSLYLQVKNIGGLKALENITLGRYRVSAGMGLVLGNAFSFGKTAMISGLSRTSNNIRVHSSRSEEGYMQGAAATVRIVRGLKASAFASYRPLDATLNDDGTARTIVTSGYHRTPTEMAKKGNTHATAVGATVRYDGGGFHLGATAVYTHLDRNLAPQTSTLYRRHYARGNDFVNAGIDYGYNSHRLSVNGETATNRNGAIATINSICLGVTGNLALTVLQRFYSYRYTSLYAGSYNDGGAVQNENGVYAGVDWRPTRKLQITAYTDFARFAWAKYRISRPSHSSDNMVAATYATGGWTVGGRYRVRLRQRDNERKTGLMAYNKHSARLYAAYDGGSHWGTRTQMDFALSEYKERESGWMISQNVSYNAKWLSLNASANYFRTDSYESRVYAYERTMLHTFSMPAFYGHGIRYALMARADIGRHLMLAAKVGTTNAFDRHTTGSGLQAIDRSSTTDLEVQARLKW